MHSRGPNSFAFGRDGGEWNNTIVYLWQAQIFIHILNLWTSPKKKPLWSTDQVDLETWGLTQGGLCDKDIDLDPELIGNWPTLVETKLKKFKLLSQCWVWHQSQENYIHMLETLLVIPITCRVWIILSQAHVFGLACFCPLEAWGLKLCFLCWLLLFLPYCFKTAVGTVLTNEDMLLVSQPS